MLNLFQLVPHPLYRYPVHYVTGGDQMICGRDSAWVTCFWCHHCRVQCLITSDIGIMCGQITLEIAYFTCFRGSIDHAKIT